jgi:hypothetical protein
MLIPREKPYLDKLNSYYLDIDKFTEHMQGEIGSGCIYCKSSFQENLIYFNEQEIIRGIVQENGQHAYVSDLLTPVLEAIRQRSFVVTVYPLSPSAVYFWGQLPPFKRAKKTYSSALISFENLTKRFKQENFSGFIDTLFTQENETALIFFNKGERLGGSFSWGNGGLSQGHEDYSLFLEKLNSSEAVFQIGKFLENEQHHQVEQPPEEASPDEVDTVVDVVDNVGLIRALEEFLGLYMITVRDNKKQDPALLLRQSFIKNVAAYPFLDPFKGQFTYGDGIVEVTDYSLLKKITLAIVDCVWEIVSEYGIEERFRGELVRWDNPAMKDLGITYDRLSAGFPSIEK